MVLLRAAENCWTVPHPPSVQLHHPRRRQNLDAAEKHWERFGLSDEVIKTDGEPPDENSYGSGGRCERGMVFG